MRLTVLGATGATGQLVVRRALADGHRVTAAVRDPARLPVTGEDLDVATVADVTDPEPLAEVCRDRDAVLSCLGPTTRRAPRILAPAAHALVRAAEAVGLTRTVVVSAAPVGPPAPDDGVLGRRIVFPLVRAVFRDVYADSAAMEEELARSPLDWTALRPGRLTNTPATGHYHHRIGTNVPTTGALPRADLAHAMLDLLPQEATRRQVVGVGPAPRRKGHHGEPAA
ncbi:NAD(P)-dependent oxidoreductase [Streptomyces sp. CMB-StM0423]|uniref:NAD(P)-dependent oxidoreductase n=1 Tax=Streptomyces sp. CMB-StM0423 TaxID=2059884 RepID=UPI000C712DC9|nr:NAD(P)H-binding protein [Streptomyces sp. CMB-StM0423]AUH39544.1 epimerase [Streptomyces sp. CMB-StM0423]